MFTSINKSINIFLLLIILENKFKLSFKEVSDTLLRFENIFFTFKKKLKKL